MRNPEAITTQYAVDRLERELVLRLIRGEYRAGDTLPSVRDLAVASGVSVNTMRSALGRLVSRGLLVNEPGVGVRVTELLESCDVGLLLTMIHETSQLERSLLLEAQLLDLMGVVFIEVAYRAAGSRSDDHLRWFKHYVRILLDRIELDTHVAHLAGIQFQLLRVLAAAAGSLAYTVVLNSFRPYLLGRAGLELFPPDTWTQMADALSAKDMGRSRQVFQRCFDRRTSVVLAELSKLRGGGEGGAAASVDLVEWKDDSEPS